VLKVVLPKVLVGPRGLWVSRISKTGEQLTLSVPGSAEEGYRVVVSTVELTWR
jgi:hypothetical protein